MLVAGRRVVSMIAYPVWQVPSLLRGYERLYRWGLPIPYSTTPRELNPGTWRTRFDRGLAAIWPDNFPFL